jgi:hypothetical protein
VRAVVYSGYGIMPELAQVADPACPVDGVVIAVGASGVCRSDWHAWKGHDPVDLPHIGGHELAGVIAQTGPEVTRWRAGDRVTVPFVCGCGRCEYCRAGDAQVCPRQTQPGFTGPGSFAELVAVQAADTNLVALPAPDGPGGGAGTGDLRLARHGRARLPADDGHGRGRHAAPRAADRTGDRPGGGRPGAGRYGRPFDGGRDDRDPAALTGGRRASRPSWRGTRRRGWSGRGCRPGPA